MTSSQNTAGTLSHSTSIPAVCAPSWAFLPVATPRRWFAFVGAFSAAWVHSLGHLVSAFRAMPSTVTKRAVWSSRLEPRFYLRLNVGIVINILLKIPGAAVTASGLQVES